MPEDKEIKKPVDTALLSNGASNVIHPNPATGYFNLNLPVIFNGLATINLNIYNSNGQLLKQIEDFSNGTASYSISDLQEGVYVVEISSKEYNLQLKNKLIIIR